MGRRVQKGLSYTFLPVDFFEDIKIQRLYKKTGNAAAPLVYQALICMIYKEGYYIEWNDDLAFLIGQKLHIDEDAVTEIFNACLQLKLFDEDMYVNYGVVTSHGIQQYYDDTKRASKLADRVAEYSLLEAEINSKNSEEIPENGNLCTENGNKFQENAISSKNSEEMYRNTQFEEINSKNSEDCKKEKNQKKEGKEEKRIEEKRKEENYYYSSLSSLSSDEEKQQQEIVFEFMMRNWAAPKKELYDKFLPWNNSSGRKWASMDAETRKAAVKQWKQSPPQKPRFSDKFLTFWYNLFRAVNYPGQDPALVWMMLDDSLGMIENGNRLILSCHEPLMQYLESRGQPYYSIIQQHFGPQSKLTYKILDK